MTYEVDGLRPGAVWEPSHVGELLEMVSRAEAAGHSMVVWGGGTQIGWGGAPKRYDVALSTLHLKSVVEHQPLDLVLTVEAGMTLAEVDAVVAPHGLRLPIDPPHPERVTVGGLLASNVSGPLRQSFGTPRDLVLGLKVAMSEGRSIKGGGRVVKNVSGYDLVRLMVGSLGTLGVIFEATFKLLPGPASHRMLAISCATLADCDAWLERLTGRAFQPSYIELYRDAELKLYVGLEGAPELVEAQAAEMGPTTRCEAAVYRWLRDYPVESPAPLVLRAAVLPSDVVRLVEQIPAEAVVLGSAGVGVLRFFYPTAEVDAIHELRHKVHTLGGTLMVERAPADLKRQVEVWDEVGDSLPLMRQVKTTLDPHGVFSPGRFVGGL